MKLYDYLFTHNADEIKQKRGRHISEISARRGTYSVGYGEQQPCIRVYLDKTDRKTYYQFVPIYRIVGPKTVMVREICEGQVNSSDEINFEWDDFNLDLNDVKRFVLYAYAY